MDTQDLKAALLDRDFERAQTLILEWGNTVASKMQAVSAEPELRRMVDEALYFAECNLYLARVMRAHIASELESNSASFLYGRAEVEQHSWRLRA